MTGTRGGRLPDPSLAGSGGDAPRAGGSGEDPEMGTFAATVAVAATVLVAMEVDKLMRRHRHNRT